MISLQSKAIICVAKNTSQLQYIEQLLSNQFGDDYVIEIATSSLEVINYIAGLEDINVKTAVLITDYQILDMTGLELMHLVERKYSDIKMMLLADDADLDFAQKIVNQNRVYSLAKLPLDEAHFIQLVANACSKYDTETELNRILLRLKMSEQEKSLILESISESIIYMNLDHHIVWKNSVADQELFNKADEGRQYEFLMASLCKGCSIESLISNNASRTKELKMGEKHRLVRYFPVLDKDGLPIGVVITLLDITERKDMEMMNASLLEMSRFVNHVDSITEMYNKAFHMIDQYFDVKLMCIIGEDYDEEYMEFYSDLTNRLSRKQVDSIMRSVKNVIKKHQNEDLIQLDNELGLVMVYPMTGKILMIVVDNSNELNASQIKYMNTIAEQIKMGIAKIENYRKIMYQANHDGITGLYNREYFIHQLSNRLRGKSKRQMSDELYSVAIIDLNYFKDVNDNFSHLVGDEVLLEIAQRLKMSLRDEDVVARIGGDEFALLFLTTSRTEIVRLIKRIQRTIAMPVEVDDIGIVIGSSVGIAYDVNKYSSIERLLSDADQAMYEAKKDKSGIGHYAFFEKSVQKKVERHQRIEQMLREADFTKELSLQYQPIVELSSGDVVGYEGYVRWRTKHGHKIGPNEFIPIADLGQDIYPIGDRVVDLAVEAIDQMNEEDHKDRFISINLTTKQLLNKPYIDRIKKAVTNRNFSNNRLHIDISEQFSINQEKKVSQRISELQDFGIQVDLDDFGTGLTSINSLSRTGVNEVKIDRQFVKRIRFDEESMMMVKSIISLAKSLDLKVTAEGVEKLEELELLKDLGCDYAQGYYFHKPASLSNILQYRPESF